MEELSILQESAVYSDFFDTCDALVFLCCELMSFK